MEFTNYAVAPKGRREFGEYNPGSNISKEITKTVYAGDTTTNVINPEPVNPTKPEQGYFMFLQSTQANFKGEEIAITAQTAETKLIAYMGTEPVCCFIGKITGDTIANYGITGVPQSGMEISVSGNGTTNTTLKITVDSSITQTTGSLQIPCAMVLNKETGMEDDMNSWIRLQDDEVLFQLTLEWNWTIESRADNTYILDLTNEIAGVNCDSGGTVVPGAIMPECTGTLYYGTDIMTAATYSYYVHPNYNVQGLTATTASTGITLVFDANNFGFEGTTLAIKVRANVGGVQVAEKTMNVAKNLPGANGEAAITRWLVVSPNAAIVDHTYEEVNPDAISVQVWKQVGGNPMVQESATTIWYRYVSISHPTNWTTGGTAMTLTLDYQTIAHEDYIEAQFALMTTGGTPYEFEAVPIVANGLRGPQGVSGATGERGAVIRGPYNWYELENQRYSNGLGPNAEDKLWIDILVKDGVYYRCTTSHDYTGQTWAQVQSAWTESNESYDFIATNLLLAENGKINIMTTNEIYFGSGSTITGGMKGGTGSTVAFWAGNSEAEPNFSVDHNGNLSIGSGSTPNFSVDYQGNLYAKQGVFAGNVYSPYTFIKDLNYYTTSGNKVIHKAEDHAYLVSDMTNNDHGGSAYDATELRLPEANSGLNGYTYDILICPFYGIRTSTYFSLRVGTINHTIIYNGAPSFSTEYYYYTLQSQMSTAGNVKITCMPVHDNISDPSVVNYAWVITYANCTITGDNN